jgi:hypothetical protein
MDAVLPALVGSLSIVVLIQIMFAKPSGERDRHIRNPDIERPGA